ncbi:hypothetical protein PVAG01_10879 [Phlyctema vagabunda]|uniref:Uncharacterized protein n=1 Tax=Phlyctema vagabunda TaxID=108571 RepID=A0ABR4P3I8_9HELO
MPFSSFASTMNDTFIPVSNHVAPHILRQRTEVWPFRILL